MDMHIEPRAPMTKICFVEKKFYAKWVDTN